MNRSLFGVVQPRKSVTVRVADELFDLFGRFYTHIDRAAFVRDLDEKDWVLSLRDGQGRVRGFTTMMLYELEHEGRRVRALFNGNTIIDEDYWGDQELVRTWCRFMAKLERRAPDLPLYWYLICSGYRTYLFLPLFFREFHPRHDASLPPFEATLRDRLGHMKFRDEYRDGVVHVAAPRECLREELATPPPAKLRNPHVRFFVEANAGYLRGDELVCLAEFSRRNTRRTAHQAILEASVRAC